MAAPLLVIFHQSPRDGEPPLTALLAAARQMVVRRHVELFGHAGVRRVVAAESRDSDRTVSFGERLADIVADQRPMHGVIVLGGGAVPMLRGADAARLVQTARLPGRAALTNNRFSSDICAVSAATALRDLPPLPTDNGLPRWLEERAGYRVRELPGRDRLALDLDTPLDLALLATIRRAPRKLRMIAGGLTIPWIDSLRELAADPRRELLVAGRTSASTLRWLERHTDCRVRFLAEERGLKASRVAGVSANVRPPRSILGRLLAARGPEELATIVAELADGAIIDTRVLLADRLGAEEWTWPSAEDRFASDLLLPDTIHDEWLRSLTLSARTSAVPILLGAHTLVGPGIPVLLGAAARPRSGMRAALEWPTEGGPQAPTPIQRRLHSDRGSG